MVSATVGWIEIQSHITVENEKELVDKRIEEWGNKIKRKKWHIVSSNMKHILEKTVAPS